MLLTVGGLATTGVDLYKTNSIAFCRSKQTNLLDCNDNSNDVDLVELSSKKYSSLEYFFHFITPDLIWLFVSITVIH